MTMRGEVEMTVPEVALVLGTRAALGIGLGLLLANRLSEEQRKAVGTTLLLAGAFSAAALGSQVFARPRSMYIAFGPKDREPERRAPAHGGARFPPADLELLTREMLRVGD
jgi:hypothetical protein